MAGTLGEIKAAAHLVSLGYRIFWPLDSHDKFDLVAFKDNQFLKVQVKSSSFRTKASKSWIVTLDNVTHKSGGGVERRTISNDNCDLLAVYIIPEDRVVILETGFEGKTRISIKPQESDG